jgi:hypothetical protein
MDGLSGSDAEAKTRLIKKILVRKFSYKLAQSPGFAKSDYYDFLHDLGAKADEALKRYDPKRGSVWGFLDTVLTNAVRNIVRFTRAQCRHPFRKRSMHVQVDSGRGRYTERWQILDGDDIHRHRGVRPLPVQERLAFVFDVKETIKGCPIRAQELAKALEHGNTTAQLARDWGVPRTSLTHVKNVLKRHLIAAGYGPKKKRCRREACICSPEPENLGKPLRRWRRCDFD